MYSLHQEHNIIKEHIMQVCSYSCILLRNVAGTFCLNNITVVIPSIATSQVQGWLGIKHYSDVQLIIIELCYTVHGWLPCQQHLIFDLCWYLKQLYSYCDVTQSKHNCHTLPNALLVACTHCALDYLVNMTFMIILSFYNWCEPK